MKLLEKSKVTYQMSFVNTFPWSLKALEEKWKQAKTEDKNLHLMYHQKAPRN